MVNEAAAWMVAAVKGHGALVALGGRIFPDVAPEGTANPCMVYQLFGDEHEAVMDAGPAGHSTVAFQVRFYADSRRAANALRDAFRDHFEGIEPVEIGGRWRIEGSGFGELADTYDRETRDYGSLGVVELHVARS